jgi:hypothetical protein
MGHIRNETMVISGWDAKRVLKAHAAASAIFDEYRMARLVSGLVQHITNGGAAFFISPDGSKENWDSSNQADAARKELIEWLKSPDNENLYLDWALIVLGGDDGEFSITSSS